MVVKLNSIARWIDLDPKKGISFDGDPAADRLYRIDLNCEAVTTFYVVQGKNERLLVTLQPGVETVEFYMAGDFTIMSDAPEGGVLFWAADYEPAFVEVIDPEIFTKIATRQARNPELEEMMYRAQLNMERRFAAQQDEIEAMRLRAQELENAVNTVKAKPAEPDPKPLSGQGEGGDGPDANAGGEDGSE